MKSMVMKSIYAGLGLLGTGKETVEELGRKIARRANVSEKDGEKIARQLRSRSEKAIGSLQKSLETEVDRIVKAVHVIAGDNKGGKKRSSRGGAKRKRAARPKRKASANAHG